METIQDSILRAEVIEKCEVSEFTAASLLAGYFVASGELGWSAKGIAVTLTMHSKETALMVAECIILATGYHPEITIKDPTDKRKSRVFVLELPVRASEEVLEYVGFKKKGEDVLPLGMSSLRWADITSYATALYLECGKLYINEDYRLILTLPASPQRLDELQEAFGQYNIKCSGKLAESKMTLTFHKGAVASFATLIKAPISALKINDFYVAKEVNIDINRASNCYAFNLDKSMRSSTAQIMSIERLKTSNMWLSLPPAVREAGELRLRYPDASLTEIASLSGLNKSTLYHRIKKILDLAEE